MTIPSLTDFGKEMMTMMSEPMNKRQKAFAAAVIYATFVVPTGFLLYAASML